MLLKMNRYWKIFNETKDISFLIDDEFLEKYDEIWGKVSNR